jgi:hypothetical protein
MRITLSLLLVLGCGLDPGQAGPPTAAVAPEGNTIATRLAAPAGFTRIPVQEGAFAAYLRHLPLRPAGSAVHLYNGQTKGRQDVQAAVVDLSVGTRDLQQCADAVMRLRAEHLYRCGRQDAIAFSFTSGFRAEWKRWRRGERISVDGNRSSWTTGAAVDSSHDQLLRFLEKVFTYAGSLSLERDLRTSAPPPGGPHDLQIGDVFIQGGSPGHAMIVVDAASSADGRTALLLAQSYMPAQEVHVVRNLRHPELGAWFILEGDDRLYTPEWTFDWSDRLHWSD